MKKSRIIAYVILAVVVLSLVLNYNSLAKLKNNVELQYAQIEVNLQRRVDLIPNYMETVKGEMEHDEAIMAMITEARATVISAMENGNMADTYEANANYDTAVANYLNFVVENYPELSAGDAFQGLRDELAGTENRIAVSRQYYNEAVSKYNNFVDTFPGIIVASITGAKHAELFSAAEGSNVAPTISFD